MTEAVRGASPHGFAVVAIGASAGGLKAAEDFLLHCPVDTGMAFVLVFHLDPNHKSVAAELLQRCTAMPVAQVVDPVRLQPDHVYVIPPDRGLTMKDGELLLTERRRNDGRPTVIDHFFRAVARHVGERSIGVVLSGTGTEGSQGVRAIKEAGGLTLVQAEADAEYSGMPRSAIATGMVDFVLPAAQLPSKIVEMRESATQFALSEADAGARDADVLQKIFVQLRAHVGHDFSHYKYNTILRRIARRMQVHRVQTLGAYLDVLRGDRAEIETLFHDLLISVTSFFRDADTMEALAQQAIAKIFARAGGEPVRVWVPGCATGEEVYSLAMLLLEASSAQPEAPRLQIFASDVDARALDVARRGVYPESIAGDITPARLERFFTHEGGGYAVRPELRETILFTRHNVLQDPPFSRLDLISCRNLLIYLKSDIQTRVYALFHFALKPHGYLFLGSSESLGESRKLFSELDRKAKLYQAQRIPVANVQLPLLPPLGMHGAVRRRAAYPEGRARFETMARDALLGTYAPPCVIVNDSSDVVYIHGRVGKYLEPGSGAANYNIYDMAREGLRLELRSALYRVLHNKEGAYARTVRLAQGGPSDVVKITVRTLPEADGHALVVFEESVASDPVPPTRPPDDDAQLRVLETELAQTRESLQTTIEELETSNEELRASNEEMQSVNEELQSTTEELETGREELQSTNEELLAVNQELRTRNEELADANADLGNLIASTEIGTLFLDDRLCVRRYTPRLADCYNLIASDIGRPFAHLTHTLEANTLVADAEQVRAELVPITREIAGANDCIYEVRVRPYRGEGNRVAGVVLTFVDVTERHHHEEQTKALNAELMAQRGYAEGIVATMREPLLVLDGDLRVVLANRSFYRYFRAQREDTEGVALYQLGQRQWDIAELRSLLDKVVQQNIEVDDFEVQHDFGAGERVLMLNARRLVWAIASKTLVLLAFEDVTEQRHASTLLAESDRKYRRLFNGIDEGFCTFDMLYDADGRPTDYRFVDVNPAFARQTGLSVDVTGRTVKELLPQHEAEWFETYGAVVATGEARRFTAWSNGMQRWFEVFAFRYGEAWPNRVAAIFTDVTERKRTERHRELLTQELNHRVRNNLAIVQSLAAQSFRGAGCDAAFASFEGRLQSVSAVHAILAREHWKGADVASVVRNGLAAWAQDNSPRVCMRGPPLRLLPSPTLALAMAIHELATNASKYGALSNNAGTISVHWSLVGSARDLLRLRWRERGGPPVVEPKHRGFGTWMIETGLAQDMGGEVKLAFHQDGLTCTLEAPTRDVLDEPHLT
jgi:two-component system CheB/CheR fusion protein